MNKIAILEPLNFSHKAISELQSIGEVELYTNQQLDHFLSDKNIIFTRLNYYWDSLLLDKCKSLKIICSPTTGVTHFDLDEIKRRSIKLILLKGEVDFLNTISATPEHTLGLCISLIRNYSHSINPPISHFDRDLYRGYEINGSKCGFIGFGRVGKKVGNILRYMGAEVSYHDIVDYSIPYYKYHADIDELINGSEIIFLTASYEAQAQFLIDETQIKLLKDKYFINTARGELVNENFLLKMLELDYFKGVALDVFQNEQKEFNNIQKFLSLSLTKNLVITPHIGGCTYTSMWRTEEFIVKKLLKDLQ
jgi:D-3-phosphoglycerate dehydrogenase